MHRFRFAALAAVAVIGFASVASAADMPVKAPVYKASVAAPVYSWTGCYFGANGGYAWAHTGIVETSVNGIPETFDRGFVARRLTRAGPTAVRSAATTNSTITGWPAFAACGTDPISQVVAK